MLSNAGDILRDAIAYRDIEVEEVFSARDALLALIGAGAIPEFKTAQQAMAYLGLTLHDRLVHGPARRPRRCRTSAKRSRKWFDVATAEQHIASRYILGRAAIYRMGSRGAASEYEHMTSVPSLVLFSSWG